MRIRLQGVLFENRDPESLTKGEFIEIASAIENLKRQVDNIKKRKSMLVKIIGESKFLKELGGEIKSSLSALVSAKKFSI